jgi:hypothetical protein
MTRTATVENEKTIGGDANANGNTKTEKAQPQLEFHIAQYNT